MLISGHMMAQVLVSTGIPARGTKQLAASLTAKAYNFSNDAEANLIDFGTLANEEWAGPSQYIKVEVDCNLPVWLVDIYTDNKPLRTAEVEGGAQRAGLFDNTYKNAPVDSVASSDVAKVPLAWVVSSVNSNTTIATLKSSIVNKYAAPSTDNGITVAGSTTTINNANWTWMKDKGDKDDPGITGDQSWSKSHEDGYTVIGYGGPSYRSLSNSLEMSLNSPYYVFLEGGWGSAAGGKTYESTIWFDLYTK